MNPTPQDKLDDLINEIDADWSHDGGATEPHILKAQAQTKEAILSLLAQAKDDASNVSSSTVYNAPNALLDRYTETASTSLHDKIDILSTPNGPNPFYSSQQYIEGLLAQAKAEGYREGQRDALHKGEE